MIWFNHSVYRQGNQAQRGKGHVQRYTASVCQKMSGIQICLLLGQFFFLYTVILACVGQKLGWKFGLIESTGLYERSMGDMS